MQMYVNYLDRQVKTPGENPTVGIVLCSRKNDALVELTLPEGSNIFASREQRDQEFSVWQSCHARHRVARTGHLPAVPFA